MPLIKTRYGLLEEENFYLTSPAIDFLGDGAWSRTASEFKLLSGEVKRRFPYQAFVIDVKKSTNDGVYGFFIESSGTRFGIREEPGGEAVEYWRIVYYERFVQAYASIDGEVWENRGGTAVELEGDLYQGFMVEDGSLTITDYRVYASPYLTLQNFPPGSLARITDSAGSALERYFDEQYSCPIFLEHNRLCSVEILDTDGNTLLTTPPQLFTLGDIFLFTTEFIQLIRHDRVLDFNVTHLTQKREHFTVRNAGGEDVHDIRLYAVHDGIDVIEFSFDEAEWSDNLRINTLEAGTERAFTVRIMPDESGVASGFRVGQFEIHIS